MNEFYHPAATTKSSVSAKLISKIMSGLEKEVCGVAFIINTVCLVVSNPVNSGNIGRRTQVQINKHTRQGR